LLNRRLSSSTTSPFFIALAAAALAASVGSFDGNATTFPRISASRAAHGFSDSLASYPFPSGRPRCDIRIALPPRPITD
jgi:hypothetical protein